ncbi:MAG TPA: ATP-binding protein, partial [Gemmatimonadaceae bacterium]|nr:ATP-binding protein [Gemmatimonadaceae bacterium]
KEKVEDDAEREQKRREDDARIADIAARLIACPDEDRPWRELLSHLMEYHRREARRDWWEVFRRLDPGMSHDDFIEDADCIGCLTKHASIQPRPEKRSRIHTLTFPEQEIKLEEGGAVRADTGEQLEIVKLDRDARILELKIGPSRKPLADVISLIPRGPLSDTTQRKAIERVAEWVLDGNADRYAAVMSILRRDIPILNGGVILADASPDNLLAGTIDAICRMRCTHLVIQGPPGTGKTFTSAHAIVALLKAGKRVGVASFTHKAINNLLTKIETVATEQQVVFAGIKKNSEADHEHTGEYIVNTDDNNDVRDTKYRLVAGTAWLFAREELDQEFDYLFVEEAGQVSLASVVAMGTSARNIVLVGDQMQLSQPVKGAHPGGSGASGLEHLMNGAATVPPDRGILLSRTWRMHPDLCAFISNAYYDGRLTPDTSTARQKLVLRGDADGALGESGLRFVPVDHTACSQRSEEEVARVNELYGALLGQQWVDQHGQLGVIGPADILVVTPYNMQVRALIDALPLGARVGTVDKFQGQEAAAVLISMASSDAEHAPRGMTFLFSRNRTNVAISRGRCLASVVASPMLLAAACSTVDQLRLANGLCFVRAYAEQHARTAGDVRVGMP